MGSENEELCELPTLRQSFNASVVAVKRGNCTFSLKAANVQALGGSAVLIVSPFGLVSLCKHLKIILWSTIYCIISNVVTQHV